MLQPILNPKINDIIYLQKGEDYIPVKILSGYFLDPIFHRLSNFWTWQNLITNEKENGYGNFYINKGDK